MELQRFLQPSPTVAFARSANFSSPRGFPRSSCSCITVSIAIHGSSLKIKSPGALRGAVVKAVLAEKPSPRPSEQKVFLESLQRELKNPTTTESSGTITSLESSDRQGETSSQNDMGLMDTSLESTWVHRMWVGIGCGAMGGMIFKAAEAADSMEAVVSSILAATAAYILADLGTGVYHWGIDNYGDASTPIFGSQIDAFQGHHKRPWTITKRQFANNIHALARPASFALFPFLLLPSNSAFDAFLGVFLTCVVFSQQFHSWAHSRKKDLPALVVALQDMGVLVPRRMHGAHHRSPYNINYCIVSGIWNPLLDSTHFFEKLESMIYSRCGLKPRSWSDTDPEWMQEGSYFSDGTDLDVSAQ